MKRIGILSDTHGCWDERFERHFADCDEIWHAGDIGCTDVIRRLDDKSADHYAGHTEICTVRAVAGNIDHGEVRRRCPELLVFDVEGVRVLLTHIGGYPGRWSKGMKNLLRDERVRLMVDGHSHILRVMYDRELDLLHVNPGAAGRQGWQKQRTLVRLVIDGADMRDCEVIELG